MHTFDIVRFTVTVQTAAIGLWDRATELRNRADERGEGVISTAIAVLIMAVIGAAMYAAYVLLFNKTNNAVSTKVGEISG